MHLLKVPHRVLLRVLIDALHTHQLVASEAEFLKISIGMLSTYEGVHGLGIILKTWVGIGSHSTHRFLV
jgi:hypothetical protein